MTFTSVYIQRNKSLYLQHTLISTGGSKQNNHATAALVLSSQTITKGLHNSASVYIAELLH